MLKNHSVCILYVYKTMQYQINFIISQNITQYDVVLVHVVKCNLLRHVISPGMRFNISG